MTLASFVSNTAQFSADIQQAMDLDLCNLLVEKDLFLFIFMQCGLVGVRAGHFVHTGTI